MQELVVGWLKKTLSPYQAIIGLQSTVALPNAKLLDITSPYACYLLNHLHKSCIVVSSRLAIVETTTDHITWGNDMTNIWKNDPTAAAYKLRKRDSEPGKVKKCAEVAATAEKIAAARARKGHAETEPDQDKPETLRVTIDLPCAVDADYTCWLTSLMEHIQQQSKVTLQRHTEEEGLDLGGWKPILNFEGGWTGKIMIQCREKQEMFKLHKAVQNKQINIQGHFTSININSNYVDVGNYLSGTRA